MATVSAPKVVENLRGAVNYLMQKEPHNGKPGDRNLFVGTLNMSPGGNFASQMERTFSGGSAHLKIQAYSLYISFSRRELDPNNPEDAYTAFQICREFAEQFALGRQCLICIQKDGKSGLLHGHILTGNVNPVTFKGFDGQGKKKEYLFNEDGTPIIFKDGKHTGEQAYHTESDTCLKRAKRIKDEVVSHYFVQDLGMNHGDVYSHNETKLRRENDQIDEENKEIEADNQKTEEHNRKHPGDRKPLKEKKTRKYIWKQDLRDRINKCASETHSWDEFTDRMKKTYHVSVENRKYVTYTLNDTKSYAEQSRRNAAAKLVKAGKTQEEADAEVEGMDFTPKRKLSARNRSLGSTYSKEAVEQRLGVSPEEEKVKTEEPVFPTPEQMAQRVLMGLDGTDEIERIPKKNSWEWIQAEQTKHGKDVPDDQDLAEAMLTDVNDVYHKAEKKSVDRSGSELRDRLQQEIDRQKQAGDMEYGG